MFRIASHDQGKSSKKQKFKMDRLIERIMKRTVVGGAIALSFFGVPGTVDLNTELFFANGGKERPGIETMADYLPELSGWVESNKAKRQRNRENLTAQEKSTLRNEFGIAHLERYSLKLLRKMLYDTTTDKKIIAVVTTRGEGFDDNGNKRDAFDRRAPHYLVNEIEFRDYDILIAEAGSRNETLERVKQIAKRGELKVIILRTHGNANGITMMEDAEVKQDSPADIDAGDAEFAQAIASMAPGLEQIATESCEGAFTGGLAMFLASKLCIPAIGQTVAGSGELVLSESEIENDNLGIGMINSPATTWQAPKDCKKEKLKPKAVKKTTKRVVAERQASGKETAQKTGRVLPTVEIGRDLEFDIKTRIERILGHSKTFRDRKVEYEARVRVYKRMSPTVTKLTLFIYGQDGEKIEMANRIDLNMINQGLDPVRLETEGFAMVRGVYARN